MTDWNDHTTLPACEVEDGSTGPLPCYWDGGAHGENSYKYVIGADGTTYWEPGTIVCGEGEWLNLEGDACELIPADVLAVMAQSEQDYAAEVAYEAAGPSEGQVLAETGGGMGVLTVVMVLIAAGAAVLRARKVI